MDDTLELRDQLAEAWRAVLDGAVERGCPPQAVIESMASVAHERFAIMFGAPAAASYLQLLAEQLRAGEQNETTTLIHGAPPPRKEPAPEAEDMPEPGVSLADLLL